VIAILAKHNFFPKKLRELLMPPKSNSQSNVLAAARGKKAPELWSSETSYSKKLWNCFWFQDMAVW